VPKQLDLLQGTLDMLILKSVSHRLEIQQGSLYPALYRLEHQGLLSSEWGESENKRKAKYYSLTAAGRQRRHSQHGRGGDMKSIARLRSWIRASLQRSRIESDMDDELLLASVGIYGIMAYAVARRTGEIGIRMALGAQRHQVLMMILRETALLAAAGIVIGIVAAAGLTRYIGSMLYGLKSSDPLTLCSAVMLLLAVALIAGWWPARRVSRLDPMVALRHE
jgi:DNA-binding PadR family transcriptional regulator